MKISRLVAVLSSILIWAIIVFFGFTIALIIILITPVCYLLDRNRGFLHYLSSVWGRIVVTLNPFWKLRVTGMEHVDNAKAYVIVANHQSLMDIIAGFCLKIRYKWMAKESLFKIPVFGWGMHCVGYIHLRRGAHGSIRESFKTALSWLNRGVSVFMFPEGTRSETGEMQSFKNGAFKLAAEAGVPVLPIVINGTRDAIVKGSWLFQPKRTFRLSILEPVLLDAGNKDSVSVVKKEVAKRMAQELTRLQSLEA